MDYSPAPKKRSFFDWFFHYLDRRKPSDRLLVYVLLITLIASSAIALIGVSRMFTTDVPGQGGMLVEGIVGTPRFVNPVLSITRTDNDLVALVYSGLMKLAPDGMLTPDLAESVTVSEDGLVYNVILRNDIQFHDGTPIRAEDVAYTIELIQNPDLKSPLRGNWNGVRVEVIDERELNIILADAYTPFMENLTVGIMPEHVWGSLSIEELAFSQHNTEPIGSGPYRISTVSRNKSGLINSYQLEAFEDGRGRANINAIEIALFQSEEDLEAAFTRGEVMSTAALGNDATAAISSGGEATVIESTLPRVFSVFFNQNKSAVLRDGSARRALSAAVDREALITDVLAGYGEPAYSPIPPGFLVATSTATTTPATGIDAAREILRAGGWTENEFGRWSKEIDGVETPLKITIATANTAVFEETAYYLEHVWNQLGAEVSVELYEQTDLVQSVIRPRGYEALLFGTEVGRALDLYPFWHSSQREDPGLNVALYANITTDSLLTKARTTQDAAERAASIAAFEAEIIEETPAVFLYSPSFTYIVRDGVHPSSVASLSRPSERFASIRDWYMNEESIWRMFVRE